MTSVIPNLHVSKNLNISKTKQDIEKLKTPLRLVWKCCSDAFKIGSTIFRRRGTLTIIWIYTLFNRNYHLMDSAIHLSTPFVQPTLDSDFVGLL